MAHPRDGAVGSAADGAVNVAVDARGAIARVWFGRNCEQLSFQTLAAGLVEANTQARAALTRAPLPTVVPVKTPVAPTRPIAPAAPAPGPDEDDDEVAGFTRG